jgi:uncharacterized protein
MLVYVYFVWCLLLVSFLFLQNHFRQRAALNLEEPAVDKPCLREFAKPEVDGSVFVQGLPGFGNVGSIAAREMIRVCGAKPFAELYSPSFPDYVSVSTKGVCQLPRYEFYHCTVNDCNFVIMTGETQPSFDDVLAHYEVCGEILDYIQRLGCKFVITVGGVPLTEEKAQIYIAATSNRRATEFMEKGAVIYGHGKIVGGTGLTLALAKERGLEGVCVLGATMGFESDTAAGLLAFKFLMKALGKEIKEGLGETH